MSHKNLFTALRSAFPADLDSTAIETADGPGAPRLYTWRDLERASAMIANLLESLELPADSRIAVQTEKSVEALMLYLGVLRAGFVYLPLRHWRAARAQLNELDQSTRGGCHACPQRPVHHRRGPDEYRRDRLHARHGRVLPALLHQAHQGRRGAR
jgi:hypothetical protein